MRGKVVAHCVRQNAVRITPAYAGKSKRRALPALSPGDHPPACAGKRAQYRLQRRCGWDHPRMCGEKHRSVGLPKSRVGSPPRMRGKRSAKPLHSYNSWDHPRVCGEKGDGSSAAAAEPGSPPRMRGKVLLSPFFQPMPGITPAYAGKRVFASTRLCNSRDHPRMCGEKQIKGFKHDGHMGSPPHVRGKD